MQRRDFFGAAAAASTALVAAQPMTGKASAVLPSGFSPTAIPPLEPLARVIATDGKDVAALREVIRPMHAVDVLWHANAGELTKAEIAYSSVKPSHDATARAYFSLFRDSIEMAGRVTGVDCLVTADELEVVVHYLMPYRSAANA